MVIQNRTVYARINECNAVYIIKICVFFFFFFIYLIKVNIMLDSMIRAAIEMDPVGIMSLIVGRYQK